MAEMVQPGSKKARVIPEISVIIPNYNGAGTIERCLEAVLASEHPSFEIIVVDDCSEDDSVRRIEQYPCTLVKLAAHAGAAGARNAGARHSTGKSLFFTDADCLLRPDTLRLAEKSLREAAPGTVIGGTYTLAPADPGFFSLFQSIFIHYSETKKAGHPDYIATHAMMIDAALFKQSGGFREDFFPILEDVEFSHRLTRAGARLVISPEILVRHIFNYSLAGSLRNGFGKSMYWTMYSLANGDLASDSGTASTELKLDVLGFYLLALLGLLRAFRPELVSWWWPAVPVLATILVSRSLLRQFYATGGPLFGLLAGGYYLLVYPLAVGAGGLAGLGRHLLALLGHRQKAGGDKPLMREQPLTGE